MYAYGFAATADLKARLGVASADTTDDAALAELLRQTAAAIEACAGRPLRRRHAVAETFPGGTELLFPRVYPIVKVYSIRESDTPDFEDSDEYEELEEGTDFVVEDVQGSPRRAIRRLGTTWLGDRNGSRHQVRVSYAGGYKTDPELASEPSTGIIALNTTTSKMLAVQLYEDSDGVYELGHNGTTHDVNKAADAELRSLLIIHGFDDVLLPTWECTVSSLVVKAQGTDGAFASKAGVVNGAIDGSPETVKASVDAAIPFGLVTWATGGLTAVTYSAGAEILPATIAAFQEAIRRRRIALVFGSNGVQATTGQIATPLNATTGDRPVLNLGVRPITPDPAELPDDLRQANLIQAAHEWLTRKYPGLVTQSMRGSAIASGSALQKQPTTLLPEVDAIAKSYRAMY